MKITAKKLEKVAIAKELSQAFSDVNNLRHLKLADLKAIKNLAQIRERNAENENACYCDGTFVCGNCAR